MKRLRSFISNIAAWVHERTTTDPDPAGVEAFDIMLDFLSAIENEIDDYESQGRACKRARALLAKYGPEKK